MGDKRIADAQALYEAAVLEAQALISRTAAHLQAGTTPSETEKLEEDRIRENLRTTRRAAWLQAMIPSKE